jgi:hypothetical protein
MQPTELLLCLMSNIRAFIVQSPLAGLSALLLLLGACSVDIPENGADLVSRTVTATGSPYRVEIKIFQLPGGLRHFNHVTYGLQMGKDGFLYFGVGDNAQDAHLFRFTTATGEMKDLGGVLAAIPEESRQRGNYGKFHVGPYQSGEGFIYFASHPREHWDGEPSGRLFRYDPTQGIVDLGPTPGNQGIYYLHGDDQFRRLYLVNRQSHFLSYDIATGTWQDQGRFSSRAPFIGLTDQQGRLYMYSHAGTDDSRLGPPTITRYDPLTGLLETSANAPPSLWVGAVTADHDEVYTTGYKRGELYRWRLSDWPDFETEYLGRIDPKGRAVFSNDLSFTRDKKKLVLAGSISSRDNWFRGSLHGVWIYEIETGRKILAANLNDVLSESFGVDVSKLDMYWTNADTVDENGWIYVGMHILPSDLKSRARLLAIRIRPVAIL